MKLGDVVIIDKSKHETNMLIKDDTRMTVESINEDGTIITVFFDDAGILYRAKINADILNPFN